MRYTIYNEQYLIVPIVILIFSITIVSFDGLCFESDPSFLQNAPVYHPPNLNADKQRIEADLIEGVNTRGKKSGAVIKGIRGSAQQDKALSSDLTNGISKVLDIESQTKRKNSIRELSFPDRLAPIASEQTGYTSREQPSLYWYISASFNGPMEFKLNEPFVSKPVLSIMLEGFPSEGIYGINLSEHTIRLKPNIEYEWFITIITDPEQRSHDIYARATIKYVEPTDDLTLELSKVSPNHKYHAYAKTGYWYDAIKSLTQLINSSRSIRTYRLHRAALLKQVNLPKAAKYDLSVVNIPRY